MQAKEDIFINFYGRRKGRLKSSTQDLFDSVLPHYQIDLPFFNNHEQDSQGFLSMSKRFKEVHFEIGCGSGDFIFQKAKDNPDILFIAVEVFLTAIGSLLKNLKDQQLDNLKIYTDNVYHLFKVLPENCFDYIYILFPDPWRKAKHNKRRMINTKNLKTFSRILKPNGKLRFVSDHYDYVSWTLHHFLLDSNFKWDAKNPNSFLFPMQDHVTTKYEQKALNKGLSITYLTFLSIKN